MCVLFASQGRRRPLGSTVKEAGPPSAPETEHSRAAARGPACSGGHLQRHRNPYRGHRNLIRAGNRRHPPSGYMFHNHTATPTQFFFFYEHYDVRHTIWDRALRKCRAIIYELKFMLATLPWSTLAPTNLDASRKSRLTVLLRTGH